MQVVVITSFHCSELSFEQFAIVTILILCRRPDALTNCPPYHTKVDGTRIHRTNTSHFPYEAYHLYCSPPGALHAEQPVGVCDPFSNPQSQEIMQLLPHPEWAVHGYPEKKGDGWVGDPRTWVLDVGALSSRLYFYQVTLFIFSELHHQSSCSKFSTYECCYRTQQAALGIL